MTGNKDNIEIERKFLVKKIPFDLKHFKSSFIRQGYISADPVIRLRQKDNEYIFTFKGKGQIKRIEFEYPLSKKQFLRLYDKIESNEIIKRRYYIPLENNYMAELDIYEGEFNGFMNIEVEFSNEEEAASFNPPLWFGKDISFEAEYKNVSLSYFGLNSKK